MRLWGVWVLFNSVEVTVSRQTKSCFIGKVKTDDDRMGDDEAVWDVKYGFRLRALPAIYQATFFTTTSSSEANGFCPHTRLNLRYM